MTQEELQFIENIAAEILRVHQQEKRSVSDIAIAIEDSSGQKKYCWEECKETGQLKRKF